MQSGHQSRLNVACAVVLMLALLVAAGCSGRPGTAGGSATSAEPTAAATAATASASATKTVVPVSPEQLAKRNANILGTMVQMQLSPDVSFGTEPSSDVWAKKPMRLYAHLSKLTTSPVSLTYDAMQVFTGAAAARQAARDGQKLPGNGVYERNATPYTQQLTVDSKAGVVLQNPGDKDTVYGSENYRRITVTTFKDFAQQFTSGDRSGELQWGGYWIYFDGSGVQCIIQQPK